MPELAADAVLLRRGHPGKGKRRPTGRREWSPRRCTACPTRIPS